MNGNIEWKKEEKNKDGSGNREILNYKIRSNKSDDSRILLSPKECHQKIFDNRIALELENSLAPVRWLTTSEAAQYLRISISSLKTMIYRGQVRAHKLGRRNRFPINELERLITLPFNNRR